MVGTRSAAGWSAARAMTIWIFAVRSTVVQQYRVVRLRVDPSMLCRRCRDLHAHDMTRLPCDALLPGEVPPRQPPFERWVSSNGTIGRDLVLAYLLPPYYVVLR